MSFQYLLKSLNLVAREDSWASFKKKTLKNYGKIHDLSPTPHLKKKENTQASAPLVLRECYDSVRLPPPSCDENRRGSPKKSDYNFHHKQQLHEQSWIWKRNSSIPQESGQKEYWVLHLGQHERVLGIFCWLSTPTMEKRSISSFILEVEKSRKTPSCWIFSILPALASQDDISCVFLEYPLLRGCIASQIDNMLEFTVRQTPMQRCIKRDPLYDRFL